MGETVNLEFVERFISSQTWLDWVSERLQPVVQGALAKAGRPVADALDGVWLGAPLHPALTDVPLGASTAAVALDGAGILTRSQSVARHADGALAVSVAGGLAAATTGWADWRDLSGETRRLALGHGLLNGLAIALNATSLGLRLSDRRQTGRLASAAGFALAFMAAHVGGELTYGRGVRVDPTSGVTGPSDFEAVADESSLDGNALVKVDVEGATVLLARSTRGEVCAIANVCSHFGGPLNEGEREGDVVICPWHGSRFDLCSGSVLGGPAVFPQPRFEARARAGKIEIRRADQ